MLGEGGREGLCGLSPQASQPPWYWPSAPPFCASTGSLLVGQCSVLVRFDEKIAINKNLYLYYGNINTVAESNATTVIRGPKAGNYCVVCVASQALLRSYMPKNTAPPMEIHVTRGTMPLNSTETPSLRKMCAIMA